MPTLGPALTSAVQAEWKSVQGCADGKGDDDPGCARAQEGQDDAAAQQQEQDQRSGEDGVLPGVAERAGERDGGAVDGADGGGPGAIEEGPGAVVAADLVEPVGAEQDEREGGAEGDHGGEDPADQACGGVADDGDGLDDRAGCDLAEGDRVEV